ncbi:hypothetical protein DSO57_1030968 [Entomophthora muscae]|uniref:Uncharacterized protein n=1 Tax=Entomophthora muscae TaxID=34485 RepID=A0ACC2RFK3_9FUNG|nr:hypothetical protein DSO57_1030968 [Entomophthora muscae]
MTSPNHFTPDFVIEKHSQGGKIICKVSGSNHHGNKIIWMSEEDLSALILQLQLKISRLVTSFKSAPQFIAKPEPPASTEGKVLPSSSSDFILNNTISNPSRPGAMMDFSQPYPINLQRNSGGFPNFSASPSLSYPMQQPLNYPLRPEFNPISQHYRPSLHQHSRPTLNDIPNWHRAGHQSLPRGYPIGAPPFMTANYLFTSIQPSSIQVGEANGEAQPINLKDNVLNLDPKIDPSKPIITTNSQFKDSSKASSQHTLKKPLTSIEFEQLSLLNLRKVQSLFNLFPTSSFAEFEVAQADKEKIVVYLKAWSEEKTTLSKAFKHILTFLETADCESKDICFQFLKFSFGSDVMDRDYFMLFVEGFDSKLAPRIKKESPNFEVGQLVESNPPIKTDSLKQIQVTQQIWGAPSIEIHQTSVARFKPKAKGIVFVEKKQASNGLVKYVCENNGVVININNLRDLSSVYSALEEFEHKKLEPPIW